MRYSDVETFLSIVRQKSLSKAATELFLAQSTVSQRLHKLEDEFGGPLVSRKQGVNEVVLTPKGKQFLEVAYQMLALWQQAETMSKEVSYSPLSIGAVESAASTFFPTLLMEIIREAPHIQLSSLTAHSMTLYNMVDRRELDYAFVVYDLEMPYIRTRRFLSEGMVLICSKGYLPFDRPVEVEDLDAHREFLDSWSSAFRAWHVSTFGDSVKPFVEVDNLPLYIEMSKAITGWSICPVSIANYLQQLQDIEIHPLNFEPPKRNLYLIERKNPLDDRKQVMSVFEKCYAVAQEEFLEKNGLRNPV